MNKTLKASDEVKKLHRMFQSLGEVVDVLDRIGSAEQAEQEAKARVDKLNGEMAKMVEQIGAARIEAQSIVAGAEIKRDEMLSAAAAAVGAAEDQAKAIVADAYAAAKKSVDAAGEIVLQAKAEAATAEVRRHESEAAVAALEKRADEARAYIAHLSVTIKGE